MTLLASVGWVACGGPVTHPEARPQAEEVAVESLTTALADATVRVEPGLIDLGTYHARPLQLSGWSYNETRGGTTFCWGLGRSSSLELFIAEVRPIRLALRGWPFPQSGPAGVDVKVRLNGEEVGVLRLRGGPAEVGVDLPSVALKVGDNRLDLEYSAFRVPAAGDEDGRRLAVAWDWIRFGDRLASTLPTVEEERLTLPAGARVDYFIDLPEAAVLRFDRLSARPDSDSRLRISIRRQGQAERVLLETETLRPDEVPGTSREIALGVDSGLARLRVERLPDRVEKAERPGEAGRAHDLGDELVDDVGEIRERRGEAVLGRPRIEGRRPAAEKFPRRRLGGDQAATKPHVILYLVDTLRADHLGAYGSERGVSPQIDAFAAESIVFERAVAQSSWTKAAVASIFTGLWPPEHGALDVDAVLPIELPTLATLFQAAGYRTGAVVANAFVSQVFGFDRGFDEFVFFPNRFVLSDALHTRALRWLDKVARDDSEVPVFLYLHTIDPHAPYDPPTEFRQRFAPQVTDPEFGSIATVEALKKDELAVDARLIDDLVSLYDADIAHNDEQFGRFLDALRDRDLYENSVIVFVSDHGEAFHEHGHWTHGLDLHGEVLQVPLIVHLPGMTEAVRVPEVVQQIDLLPTILDAAGLDPESGLAGGGRSLLQTTGAGPGGRRPIFSHITYFSADWVSVEWGRWKLIRPLDGRPGQGLELYDLDRDAAELHNVASERPVVSGYLATLMRRELRRARMPAAEKTEIDPATRDQLEALGYLQ